MVWLWYDDGRWYLMKYNVCLYSFATFSGIKGERQFIWILIITRRWKLDAKIYVSNIVSEVLCVGKFCLYAIIPSVHIIETPSIYYELVFINS